MSRESAIGQQMETREYKANEKFTWEKKKEEKRRDIRKDETDSFPISQIHDP